MAVACNKPALGFICPRLVMESGKNGNAEISRKDYSVDYPYLFGLDRTHTGLREKL